MTDLAPFIAAYGAATFVVVVAATTAYLLEEVEINPLAYVFWPLIAAMACAVKLREMWRGK